MGASQFESEGRGPNAKAAFRAAVEEAQYESGHGGYTGTIAEKDKFVLIPGSGSTLPTRAQAYNEAADLIDKSDPRIDDKWGPAGAIEFANPDLKRAALGERCFLFFGWASN
jgi:hypothetical protein